MYSKKHNETSNFLIERDDLYCNYCNKKCKNLNSLRQHECRCSSNPNRLKIVQKGVCNIPLEKRGWSKGLTKDTDDRLKNISIGLNKYYENHDGTFKGKTHSKETRKNLSELAINNNYQSHWGVRHTYEYQDEKFQSTYEVDVVKSLDNNHIKWEKPRYGLFTYFDLNNKKHTYTPDIFLPEYNVYLDPKNDYLIENINPSLGFSDCDKIKWVCEQNSVKIIILNKDQLSWDVIKNLVT